MKRGIGLVLVGLGVFLVVLGALMRFTVVPAVAKAPLSPGESDGGVTQTDQAGVAAKLFDPATLTERTDVPLTVTRFTRGDVPASQTEEAKAGDLAIYDTFQRVEDNAGVVVLANTARFAFNRVTSEMSNCCGANLDGENVEMSGIVPLKFPMFTQPQNYPYFDTSINDTVEAVYQGQEDLDGLPVYKYVVTVEPTQTGTIEVPGDLVGSPLPTFVAPRYYSNVLTMFVEPQTGAIVKGESVQVQTLRGPDNTDKVTILDAVIGTTPEEASAGVEYAKTQSALITLLNSTVPLVAVILGAILLIVGAILVLTSKRRQGGTHAGAPTS
ncbi:MAG: hypothetical protein B7C55_09745 [Actinomycetales bacterium mxb001]|nr:MAG: hypothetical protein B7C55_09745 [Actinomycetales bacterium mxb001]